MNEEKLSGKDLWNQDLFQSDEPRSKDLSDPLLDEEIQEEVDELNKLDQQAETSEQKAEREKVQREITQLQKAIEDSRDKLIRAQAEMENIRRRAQLDVEKAYKFSLEQFVKELLPVIDSLEKALETATEADRAHLKGVELTLKIFLDALKKFNIKPINPLHEPFDPALHEALSTIPNSEVEANTILQVFQKGYELNGRLVRHAKVIVASG